MRLWMESLRIIPTSSAVTMEKDIMADTAAKINTDAMETAVVIKRESNDIYM